MPVTVVGDPGDDPMAQVRWRTRGFERVHGVEVSTERA
jgi:hypothetical protein